MNVLPSRWTPHQPRALPNLIRCSGRRCVRDRRSRLLCGRTPSPGSDTPTTTATSGVTGPRSSARERSPTYYGSPPPPSAAAPSPARSIFRLWSGRGSSSTQTDGSRCEPRSHRSRRTMCAGSTPPCGESTVLSAGNIHIACKGRPPTIPPQAAATAPSGGRS